LYQIQFLGKIKSKSKSNPNQILEGWQVLTIVNDFRGILGVIENFWVFFSDFSEMSSFFTPNFDEIREISFFSSIFHEISGKMSEA